MKPAPLNCLPHYWVNFPGSIQTKVGYNSVNISNSEPPKKTLLDINIVISIIDKQYADLAWSSLKKIIEKITQTSKISAGPFISLGETRESS